MNIITSVTELGTAFAEGVRVFATDLHTGVVSGVDSYRDAVSLFDADGVELSVTD